MRKLLVVAMIALTFLAGSAVAASRSTGWTKRERDMTTAVKALGYPKPHPKTLTCKGTTAFRCKAVYRHHTVKRFAATWQGEGGWICAGTKVSTCKLLRHGYATGQAAAVAELAAQGWFENKYKIPQPFVSSPCTQTGTLTWQCGWYVTDTSAATVTLVLKAVKGGYLTSASATVQPTG